jgi:hypothetical protein
MLIIDSWIKDICSKLNHPPLDIPINASFDFPGYEFKVIKYDSYAVTNLSTEETEYINGQNLRHLFYKHRSLNVLSKLW